MKAEGQVARVRSAAMAGKKVAGVPVVGVPGTWSRYHIPISVLLVYFHQWLAAIRRVCSISSSRTRRGRGTWCIWKNSRRTDHHLLSNQNDRLFYESRKRLVIQLTNWGLTLSYRFIINTSSWWGGPIMFIDMNVSTVLNKRVGFEFSSEKYVGVQSWKA